MTRFELNLRERNISKEKLLEDLKKVAKSIGQETVTAFLYSQKGKFGVNTFLRRFGSWNKALQAFIDHINDSSENKNIVVESAQIKQKTGQSQLTSRKINRKLIATILIRDSCICKMCGVSSAKDPSVVLHVDHIKPWLNGGETELDNLRTLCSVCNIGRSNAV